MNNAGGGDVADYRTLLQMDDKCWFDNIDLNLHGTWYFTKALSPHMVERRHGRMLNIALVAGLQGVPRLGAYAAAKHAVVGLSRTLAAEAGEFGVTCNRVPRTDARDGRSARPASARSPSASGWTWTPTMRAPSPRARSSGWSSRRKLRLFRERR